MNYCGNKACRQFGWMIPPVFSGENWLCAKCGWEKLPSPPYKYRGWQITFNDTLPVTGQWRAEKAGVGLCADSPNAIRRMVEQKNNEPWTVWS